jgi:hypothetical protein
MKTPEFWRRITQVLPELLLDSSAIGNTVKNITQQKRFIHLGLCEDSVLFCQNHNIKHLTEIVQANPLLYKVVAQVIKEWTSTSNTNDVQLSPGNYMKLKII